METISAPDKSNQMIFDAGGIIGLLLKHSEQEWFDLHIKMVNDKEFRYSDPIYMLAKLRRELTREDK